MLNRCYNEKNEAYKHYGGRGIKVCERRLVFENFLDDIGERPGLEFIDFTPDGAAIESAMAAIDCRAGNTQIGRVLAHFIETAPSRPSAFVFIGDDQQEPIDGLLVQASTLSAYKIPTFWFLEQTRDTSDQDTEDYKALASASGGVFAEFTESAADRLEELLVAAATFAIGGRAALAKSAAGQALLTQMK